MGFSTRFALAGSLLGAAMVEASPVYGNQTTGHIAYTTEVVTAYTTYCPAATTLTFGEKTYTITSATTLTITDCPCTVRKPVASSTGTPKDKCAQACYDAYNNCRVKSGANMASCAAEYAACLGYNPFSDEGSLVTPTACSVQTAVPTKPAHTEPVVYTTEVVTAITTYCPEPTTLSYNNKTYTITKPTTLTITDCPCTISKPSAPATAVPSQPAPDCPQMCSTAYNKCRTQPGANMSSCAAAYASCLGYSPFGPDGSLIAPTACSQKLAPATSQVPEKPSNPAVTTNIPGKPTASAPNPNAPAQPAPGCAEACAKAYSKCRSNPEANRSTCASEYASCLGYSPFDSNGSLVTPTACSVGATGATSPASVPTQPVIATAAAGRIAPAGALFALGALALL